MIERMINLQANRKDGTFIHWEEHQLFYVMLADEGWYMDYNFAIGDLQKLYIHQVTHTDIKVLDYYMVKHYKKKLSSIVRFFKKNHSDRFSIIEKAFEAHERGYYA